MQYPFQTEELKEEEESFDKVELSEEVELAAEELSSSLIEGTKPMEKWAMAKPMDVTFHNIHGFCHGTMGKPITWQNPYIMSFAMVYGFCHRSMAKPIGYPIPA